MSIELVREKVLDPEVDCARPRRGRVRRERTRSWSPFVESEFEREVACRAFLRRPVTAARSMMGFVEDVDVVVVSAG